MKQNIRNMFFVISIFLSFSCKDDGKSNEVKHYKVTDAKPLKVKGFEHSQNAYTLIIDTFYYENGKIKEIFRTKNGKLDGLCLSFYQSGILESQKYFYNDTSRGIFLQFFENGKIKKSSYVIDNEHNIWYREYNVYGKVIKEEGIPLIRGDIHESDNHDTTFLKIFICNYGAKKLKFELSSNDKDYKVFDLKPTDEPYVVEASTWKLAKQLKRFSYYSKITFVDSFGTSKVYKDTATFEHHFGKG